jgi:hypothetical protein
VNQAATRGGPAASTHTLAVGVRSGPGASRARLGGRGARVATLAADGARLALAGSTARGEISRIGRARERRAVRRGGGRELVVRIWGGHASADVSWQA